MNAEQARRLAAVAGVLVVISIFAGAQTKETGEMCSIASPRRTPRCSGLLTSTLLLAIVAAATGRALADTGSISTGDPAPDEISYFGERVYSLRQWPPDTGYGISYRKTFTPYFAASLAYLNDAHFPGHHRDGVTAEAWLPLVPLSNRFTLSVGGGPFYYYDTVFCPK